MKRNGPWVAIDAAILRNPKVAQLSPKARVLFVAALCHSADGLTDGLVGKASVGRLLGEAGATRGHLSELVRVGLVERCDDGWRIPSYLDWNPDRAWWERKRTADARRQREWRAKALGRTDSDGG